jgi:hypothetical protein
MLLVLIAGDFLAKSPTDEDERRKENEQDDKINE